MSDIVKCKKCRGVGSHRDGKLCGTCKGSGKVAVSVDAAGVKTITAVQS